WPSVYEKAYGMFRGLDQDKPDISQLGFWNPLTALWEVSGISVDARFLKSYPATTPTPTQKFNTAKIFGEICSKGGMSPGLKTKRPMVAWTFLDGTQTPYSDAFTNDLIVGNHAYSILGTTFVSGMGNCIVLRNPYGISKVTTSIPGVSSCKPTWSPVSLQISQGNFAMTTEPFTHYFEGFCYTTV
ncbi:MAG: hypothetical protein LUQ32_01470, partial [Methanomicrobiales archaeon]|nr:hypothetical protein [Methanomicrobiales archaeon]